MKKFLLLLAIAAFVGVNNSSAVEFVEETVAIEVQNETPPQTKQEGKKADCAAKCADKEKKEGKKADCSHAGEAKAKTDCAAKCASKEKVKTEGEAPKTVTKRAGEIK